MQLANGLHYPLYHKVIVHFDTLQHRPLTSNDLETTKQLSETNLISSSGKRRGKSIMIPAEPVEARKLHPSDQYRTFYVFKYLPFDVLIGQPLLDAIDAYCIHPDAFIKVGYDGPELSSPQRPLTARETDDDHHLHVIRSRGSLLSKFKGRKMTGECGRP